MRSHPAPMVGALPDSRPVNMTWEYDWLGNAVEWTDDAHQFYERSIGAITNGADYAALERPGSLRVAADLDGPSGDRGGWVEVDYGEDGNVLAMTVHAACTDAPAETCDDEGGNTPGLHAASLRSDCVCAQEQHYVYRWDEVNRIAEAMRFERTSGSGAWTFMVRQRYLYDAANERRDRARQFLRRRPLSCATRVQSRRRASRGRRWPDQSARAVTIYRRAVVSHHVLGLLDTGPVWMASFADTRSRRTPWNRTEQNRTERSFGHWC